MANGLPPGFTLDSMQHPANNRPMLRNPDGSVSTEESLTITDPRINSGRPTNIPSIWNGQRFDEDQAVMQALNSGQSFSAFNSIEEAVNAARQRSDMLGETIPADAGTVRPMTGLPPGFTLDSAPVDTGEQMNFADQQVNIGAKGDMRPGDIVQPDLRTSLVAGPTLSGADEIISGAQAPVRATINALTGQGPQGLSENFQQAQAREAAIRAATEEQHPILSTVAEVGGSLPVGGVAAKFIAATPKTVQLSNRAVKAFQTGKAATAGAGIGATQGFLTGDGLEDRTSRAKTGAGIGAATAVGGEKLARAAGAIYNRYATSKLAKALPTFSVIKAKARKFYDASEKAGVHVKSEAVDDFKSIVNQKLQDVEFIPENFPEVTSALRRIEKVLTFNPSLKRLDKARGALKKALGSLNKEDRNMAMIVKSSLDDFVNNLTPQQVTSGDPALAVKFLNEARKLWAQSSKVETLELIMDKARRRAARTGSGANIENVIRQEFDKILNNRNLSRGFSSAELAAIRVVVEGTKKGNRLRLVGKAAPTGIVSGGGGASAGALVGGAIGGPVGAGVGAAAVPAVGAVAKSLADRSTMKAAERVMQNVAAGKPLHVRTPAQLEQLIRRLVIAQTGQLQPAQ